MLEGENPNNEEHLDRRGQNHYEILGVPENADLNTIKEAYRSLAKKHHPDLKRDKEEKAAAELKFQQITSAYSTLSDQSKRTNYDRSLAIGKQHDVDAPKTMSVDNILKNIRARTQEELTERERRIREARRKTQVRAREATATKNQPPKTPQRLEITRRKGLLIGKENHFWSPKEFLLDPETGRPISKGYDRIERRGRKIVGIRRKIFAEDATEEIKNT